MELRKYEITDSAIEIDGSYDDSTTKLKLLVGSATSANLARAASQKNTLPGDPEVIASITKQKWISDEYIHLWNRDEGGSAALKSGAFLVFILQTPRDQHSFCSLSLVNREKFYCGGLYIADDNFNLNSLLASQTYENRHPKVPRDFSILPFTILRKHVDSTLLQTQDITRKITEAEKRIADGIIRLDKNEDFKMLNRLNLEHARLQRRSHFEVELGHNLIKYLDLYHALWINLWEGGTDYVDDMKAKVEQQMRYSEQVRKDLEMLPRRIDNQSKAMSNHIIREDNKLNISIARTSQSIAEQARYDNMLNLRLAKSTARVAEATRQDSAAMKTIAILTLTFLPGTAVATLFSMNGMFNWTPSPGEPIASPYLYVYFVVTVPITIFVYVAWVWWFKYYQKQNNEDSTEFDDIEKSITMRTRTVTFSPSFSPPQSPGI